MDEIIQLKITLEWTSPPIWRRVLVDKNTTFFEFHQIIQVLMGWEDAHLYEFNIKDLRIGERPEGFDHTVFRFCDDRDDKKETLGNHIKAVKEKFKYIYDFGDNWTHKIVVEKFLPRDASLNYPICIKGKMNGPVEDCGGVYGFYELLDTISDENDPEREEALDWLGEDYDPEHFDKDGINAMLGVIKSRKKYRRWQ